MKLLMLFVVANAVALMEFAGATAVVVGVGLAWGLPFALIALGVFLLLKAFELDVTLGVGEAP